MSQEAEQNDDVLELSWAPCRVVWICTLKQSCRQQQQREADCLGDIQKRREADSITGIYLKRFFKQIQKISKQRIKKYETAKTSDTWKNYSCVCKCISLCVRSALNKPQRRTVTWSQTASQENVHILFFLNPSHSLHSSRSHYQASPLCWPWPRWVLLPGNPFRKCPMWPPWTCLCPSASSSSSPHL